MRRTWKLPLSVYALISIQLVLGRAFAISEHPVLRQWVSTAMKAYLNNIYGANSLEMQFGLLISNPPEDENGQTLTIIWRLLEQPTGSADWP